MSEGIPYAFYADRTVRRHVEDARRVLNKARVACAQVVRVSRARKKTASAAFGQMLTLLSDIKRLTPVIEYVDPDLQPEGVRHLIEAQQALAEVSEGLVLAQRSLRSAADVWGMDTQQRRGLRRAREAQEILATVLGLLGETGKPLRVDLGQEEGIS